MSQQSQENPELSYEELCIRADRLLDAADMLRKENKELIPSKVVIQEEDNKKDLDRE